MSRVSTLAGTLCRLHASCVFGFVVAVKAARHPVDPLSALRSTKGTEISKFRARRSGRLGLGARGTRYRTAYSKLRTHRGYDEGCSNRKKKNHTVRFPRRQEREGPRKNIKNQEPNERSNPHTVARQVRDSEQALRYPPRTRFPGTRLVEMRRWPINDRLVAVQDLVGGEAAPLEPVQPELVIFLRISVARVKGGSPRKNRRDSRNIADHLPLLKGGIGRNEKDT